MDSSNPLIKSSSLATVAKSKPLKIKDLQSLAKKSSTPKFRRELMKSISTTKSAKSKAAGISYDLQLSSSSLFHSYKPVKKVPSTKRLRTSHKDLSHPSLKTQTSPYKQITSPKKLLNILKYTPQPPQNPSSTSTQHLNPNSNPNPKKRLISSAKKLKKPSVSSIVEGHYSLSFRTRTGSINGKQKPNNQDEFFVIQDYGQCRSQTLLGVMDGHGLYGHEVSAHIKKQLPVLIESSMPQEIDYSTIEVSPTTLRQIEQAFVQGYEQTQKSLVHKKSIDINYSGSTAISVLLRHRTCICANLGDSRAIIGRYEGDWYPVEISHDHKPSNTYERYRIEMAGGRIGPYRERNGDLLGPDRVWLQHEELPGLAMSRSFGDLVAAHVGVISEPEVIVHQIRECDKFLVLASDGVWEFISNHSCVAIVAEFYEERDIEKACDKLMATAVKSWNEQDSIVDDITFVVVFFDN